MFQDIFKGKRVLVTGHTGFKGSWLTLWLVKLGARVTGYSLPPAYEDSHFELLNLKDHIRHIEGDIRDFDHLMNVMEVAKPEFIFHLGAQALVREAYSDPKTTWDINVGGSVNVLESVRHSDSVRVLVYITSDKCYRNVEWEWGYRETDILGGIDPYGASKGCAEIVFDSYLNSFLLDGGQVNAASARSSNVIGGGDWAKDRVVPDCIRALQKGEPIVIRNPHSTRPWQHVLEAIGAYLFLGWKLYNGTDKKLCTSWNFGPDKTANKSVRELVEEIVEIWGSGELVVQPDSKGPQEASLLHLNCDKAYQLLGWKPTWDFPDAVRHTVDWYRAFTRTENMWDVSASQIDLYVGSWKELGHR